MKTGIIVGRWQVPYLHEGHRYLIDYVNGRSDKLVLVVGEPHIYYTDRNPLPFELRQRMLNGHYPEADVLSIRDNRSDQVWSDNLDKLLENYENVTLYGSRDCFIEHYKGKYPTKIVKVREGHEGHTGTGLRKSVSLTNHFFIQSLDDTGSVAKAFREGMIYAIEKKFPVAYPTVDVAVVKYDSATCDHQLLLGRKSEEGKYCFIGGFVDPADESKEEAAYRELHEEVLDIETHEFKYISSHKIRDTRYYGTKDGIITSLFITYWSSGTPRASDDIVEARWFDINGFDKEILTNFHHPLLDSLQGYLAEKQYCSYHEENGV